MTYRIEVPGFGKIESGEEPHGLDFRVLLVDDEREWTSTTAELLETKGIPRVDVAHSIDVADALIAEDGYDAVLFDIVLDESARRGEAMQGDDWFLERVADKEYAFSAAVTGHAGRIRSAQDLEARGVKIVKKGDDAEFELYESLAGLAIAKKEATLDLVGSILRGERRGVDVLGSKPLPRSISEEAEDLFLEWLRSRNKQDERVLWIGGENLSVRELTSSVESRGAHGTLLLEAFIRHLRNLIGLSKVN